MSELLLRALGTDRDEIEKGLRDAHRELAALHRKIREIELATAQGRAILDFTGTWIPWPPLPGPPRPPTLHQAMAKTLEEFGNAWMATSRLAREIARRGLYRRRDGLPPRPSDISARVCTYPDLFVRDGWYVRLRNAPQEARRDEGIYLPRFDPPWLWD